MSSEDNSEPVPPAVFNVLREVTDSMKELTRRMTQIEAIALKALSASQPPPIPTPTPSPPIPLGNNIETGNPSNPRGLGIPLEDQRPAYQAALNGQPSPNG